MTSRIGSDLQRARTRREIALEDVEAATRIRGRFLRAIEAEDWDDLPGGVYTRGFIRTYASFLGLDGERLAEDFRREVEGQPAQSSAPARELAPVAASTASRSPRRRGSLPYLRWLAVAAVLALAAVAIVAIPGGGGGEGSKGDAGSAAMGGAPRGGVSAPRLAPKPERAGVEVELTAEAEVWVCLIDGKGKPLVQGKILQAGDEEGPFRSGSFTFSLGNGEVTMLIDGKQAEIPASAEPLGYAIASGGALSQLQESERPTCT